MGWDGMGWDEREGVGEKGPGDGGEELLGQDLLGGGVLFDAALGIEQHLSRGTLLQSVFGWIAAGVLRISRGL